MVEEGLSSLLWIDLMLRLKWIVPLLLLFTFTGCKSSLSFERAEGREGACFSVSTAKEAEDVCLLADSIADSMRGELGLTSSRGNLRVYAFRTRREMRIFLEKNCPRQASKEAACFATDDGMVISFVMDDWSQRQVDAVTHELSHYVVASEYRMVPPWVDEGLAQHFEYGNHSKASRERKLKIIEKYQKELGEGFLSQLVNMPRGKDISLQEYLLSWAVVEFLFAEEIPDDVSALHCYISGDRAAQRESHLFETCFETTIEEVERRSMQYYGWGGGK